MQPDPNADLIGQTITVEGKLFTVVCSAPWSKEYVLTEGEDEQQSMAVAAYVRANLR